MATRNPAELHAYVVRGGTRTWIVEAPNGLAAVHQVLEQLAPEGRAGRLAIRPTDFLAHLATPADLEAFEDAQRLEQNARRR